MAKIGFYFATWPQVQIDSLSWARADLGRVPFACRCRQFQRGERHVELHAAWSQPFAAAGSAAAIGHTAAAVAGIGFREKPESDFEEQSTHLSEAS